MKYAAYTDYRETPLEWAGPIPGHWKIKKIGHLALLKSGENIVSEEIAEGGEYPVFGGNGFRGYFNQYTHDGDFVLIGRQGALCGNINYASGKFWASEHALVAHLLAEFDIHWFGETLRAMNLNQYSVSAAQPGLAASAISALRVPFPPVDEQQAITRFLDAKTAQIDTLVAKKRQLIDKLKEKRSALIARTVTRGLPPEAAKAVGLEPNPEMKDSGVNWIGDIPSSWKIERLRRVCRRVTDGAHISPDLSSDDFPFVSTVDIANGNVDMKNCLRTSVECYEYLVRTGCKPFSGDVLFSKDGTVGRTAVIDFSADFVVASSLVIISPDSRHLNFRFLDYWLNNSLLQQEVTLQMAGAALRRISVEKIGRLPVLLPPPNEQQAIVLYLDDEVKQLDALVTKTEAAIDRLTEYRQALITSAVTGKIDVRNHEHMGATSHAPVALS